MLTVNLSEEYTMVHCTTLLLFRFVHFQSRKVIFLYNNLLNYTYFIHFFCR